MGTVLSSEVRPAGGQGDAWVPVVTFQYRHDGRDFTMTTDEAYRGATGSPSRFNPWSIPRSRESAMASISNLQPGAECTVYYDASDPSTAMLSSAAAPAAAVRFALAVAVAAVLVAGLVAFLFASSGK